MTVSKLAVYLVYLIRQWKICLVVKVNENRFVGFALLLDNIPDKTTATGKTAHKVHTFKTDL